jgi:hypothetical protein
MADQTVALPFPVVPPEVLVFATERGIDRYVPAAIDLARQAFPSSAPVVYLGEDAEDATHRYIALDVEVSGISPEDLLAAQSKWSAGLSQVCPSRYAVYFVLAWR